MKAKVVGAEDCAEFVHALQEALAGSGVEAGADAQGTDDFLVLAWSLDGSEEGVGEGDGAAAFQQLASQALSALNRDRLVIVRLDHAHLPLGLRDAPLLASRSADANFARLARRVRKRMGYLAAAPLSDAQRVRRGLVLSSLVAAPAALLISVGGLVVSMESERQGDIGAFAATAGAFVVTFLALSLVYWAWRGLSHLFRRAPQRALAALKRRRLGLGRAARLAATPLALMVGVLALLGAAGVVMMGDMRQSAQMAPAEGVESMPRVAPYFSLETTSEAVEASLERRGDLAQRMARIERLLGADQDRAAAQQALEQTRNAAPDAQTQAPGQAPEQALAAQGRQLIPAPVTLTAPQRDGLVNELAAAQEAYTSELSVTAKRFGATSAIADPAALAELNTQATQAKQATRDLEQQNARARVEFEKTLNQWRAIAAMLGGLIGLAVLVLLAQRIAARVRASRKLGLSIAQAEENGEGNALFVSYARRDASRVERVVAAIEALGRSVWLDQQRLNGQEEWTAQLTDAIAKAGAVAVICSRAAFASDYVARELHLAMEEKKHIIALFIEPVEMPQSIRFILAGAQRFEITSDQDIAATLKKALA